MKQGNKIFVTIILFLILIQSALAQTTITLNSSAIVQDSYVSSNQANTNFGTSQDMIIRSATQGRIMAMTWNISMANLPMNIATLTATLNLTTQAGASSRVEVFDSDNVTWGETAITFNNFFCTFNATFQVTGGQCNSVINRTTFSAVVGEDNEMDVSNVITSTTDLMTFVIASDSNDEPSVTVASKEDIDPAVNPTLTITFTTSPPDAPITELDDLDLTASCMDSPRDMTYFEDEKILYVWGSNIFDERISVINATDPTDLNQISCFNYGDILDSAETINFLPSTTAGVDGYLLAAGQTIGTGGLRILNITDNGATITNDKSVAVLSGFQEVVKLNNLVTDDEILLGCDFSNQRYYEINRISGDTILLETLGGGDCKGISEEIRGSGNAFHFTTGQNTGQTLFENLNVVFSDNVLVTNSGRDRIEQANGILAVGSNNLQFYEFSSFSNNITFQDSFNGFTGVQVGNTFIGVNQFMTTDVRSGAPFDIDFLLLDISDISNVLNISTTQTAYNSSPGIVTLIYDFPILYMMASNSPTDFVVAFEFTSSEFNITNNKKPVITNLQGQTDNVAQTNVSKIIGYQVDNPETAGINEKILTNFNCEYREEILFTEDFEDFNFSAKCASFPLGVIKGNNFGNGLNLSACFNDLITIPGGSIANNTIVSFDIFAPEGNGSSFAQIDLIQFNGDVIEELFINISNNVLNMFVDNRLILDGINLNSSTGNTPTRIFLQFNPLTSNSQLKNTVYYSTNFFLQNNVIDKTFCDANEFCYLGDFSSSAANFNNFFGILIDDTQGNDIVLDNFQVRQLNEYPVYVETTDEIVAGQCLFLENGDFQVRAYASDETFGHNYLGNEEFTMTVQVTGLVAGNGTLAGTSGLAEIFTFVAGAFVGSDPGTLILMSLLFIGVMVLVAFKFTGSAAAGLVMGGIWTLFFFFVTWLPLLALFILVLVIALGFAVMGAQAFRSGGM